MGGGGCKGDGRVSTVDRLANLSNISGLEKFIQLLLRFGAPPEKGLQARRIATSGVRRAQPARSGRAKGGTGGNVPAYRPEGRRGGETCLAQARPVRSCAE
jgi:hypothetical protein